MPKNLSNNINLLGCKVSNLSSKELLNSIYDLIMNKESTSLMLSANVHSLNLAQRYLWLRDMLNHADLVRNDSMGLLLASRILKRPLKERITWADFGWDLGEFCSENGISLFFLGDKNQIAEEAKEKMIHKFPSLQVVGTQHGYFNKTGPINSEVIDKINMLKPDILIVGFGMPLQEKWILDNKDNLKVKIIMTGGNCFSYISGREKRAPNWMCNYGLEWLFRFIREPKRMFVRYIIGNPLFMIRVLFEKFRIIKF